MKRIIHEDLEQAEVRLAMFGQELKVSVYYLDGLLIDTGPSRKAKELRAFFESKPIEQIVLTHHHEDHTGMANWLYQRKLPIYMHENGRDIGRQSISLPFYRRVFWGQRKPFETILLKHAIQTNLYSFEPIHTPGHAPDHVSLLVKEKGWLFGGDLFVQPYPKSAFAFEDIPEMMQSLRKVLAYDFDLYICSHAGPLPNGRQLLAKKLAYLEEMAGQIVAAHQKGWSSEEIRQVLFPNHHPMERLSFGESSPMHMIHSILKAQ
ncbi:MBL fold metallo-hydrolase [Ornithinibacillus gellani]|uniref:MBL fold metallo-hydrolase n=1 Tax=Ornithinibacillus gellani TaxID=2293253 RepID=UPI000F47C69F|nr:MBL fold metallo-hydrolase [Ornithinibacillus gellani]TQS75284.1 MBL fold metallo-hydrolase [Ornithinibacillus gellani]